MGCTAVLLLGALGLAGCDQAFGLELAGEGADAGGPEDGGPDDDGGAAAGCIPTTFAEPFDDVPVGADVCQPWGFAGGSGATPTREGGALVIRPPASQIADGACANGPLVPFEPGGVFLELAEVLAQASSYTFLDVRWDNDTHALRINIGPAQLVVTSVVIASDGSQQTIESEPELFSLATARWWRLRPVADALVAEISGDGHQWRELARIAETPPAQVRIGLHAGTFAPTAAPGVARFAGLNVCPP